VEPKKKNRKKKKEGEKRDIVLPAPHNEKEKGIRAIAFLSSVNRSHRGARREKGEEKGKV